MPVNTPSLRNFIANSNGSMAVEFVVLVPMLLSALVFSFEFGKAFWAYDTITRDLRGAVRYLARASTDCSTFHTEAENIATTGVTSGGTAHFPWTGSPAFNYTYAPFSGPNYNSSGTVVTMKADVPITLTFLDFLNRILATRGPNPAIQIDYTLSVAYQARCIGS